ncbi:MAG: hypothetical protein AAGD18_20560 [Actinomycetota bacterium]
MHGDHDDPTVWTRWCRAAARRLPRRVALRLPEQLGARVLSWRDPGRAATSDHRVVAAPTPFDLEVYWLRNGETEGPAASLWLGSLEVMRIDGLFGEPHVHYDLAWSRARRRANFAAHRVIEIDDVPSWIADELRLNLRYALSLQRSRRLRELEIDQSELDAAAHEVEGWARDAVDHWSASAT